MTPAQFERICYDLELHLLPKEIQDAWREMAIGTLKALVTEHLSSKTRVDTTTVQGLLCVALDEAAAAYETCAIDSLDMCIPQIPPGHRHSSINKNGNWHGYVCSAFLVRAIVVDNITNSYKKD
jgi:hypothetical protein